MAEEVSSIGVKLSLNAGSFMTGMTAATEKTEQFVAAAKEAQTVAGAGSGSRSGPSVQAAQRMAPVAVDLSVSTAQIRKLREQIIAGIGTINIPITTSISKAVQNEAKAVLAAAATPTVGTRSGARVQVDSTVARNLPKRGYGGPVQAHQGYLVGEYRPEVFTPRTGGTIHPDASRFYREEEQRARRSADAERQHMERMGRIRGGGVRGYGGKYGSSRPGGVYRGMPGEAPYGYHATDMLPEIRGTYRSTYGTGVYPNSPLFNRGGGPDRASFWSGSPLTAYGQNVLRTPMTEDFAGVMGGLHTTPGAYRVSSSVVPRSRLQYYGQDESWHRFRRGRARGVGGRVRPFCTVCNTNIANPATHNSTAKHQAKLRGPSRGSGDWLRGPNPFAALRPGAEDEHYEQMASDRKAYNPRSCPTCGLVNWPEFSSGMPRANCFKCGAPMRGGGGPVHAAKGIRAERMTTELGTERKCSGCGEFWPEDDEFWYMQHGRPMGNCRACWADRSRAKSASQVPAHAMAGRLDVSGIEGNFRKYFGQASSGQVKEGKEWYQHWGGELHKEAKRLGIQPKILTSVAAALSPNNGWPGNFYDAIKYAEASSKGMPMPKASTFGANQRKAWAILQESDPDILKGLKVTEFGSALLGDPNAKPQDIWMKRAAVDDLLLARSKGTPAPSQRREMDRVVDLIAGETGLESRQVQAIIWTSARDQAMAQAQRMKHARLRHGGGPAYAARGAKTYTEADFRTAVGPKRLAEWAADTDDPERFTKNLAAWQKSQPTIDATIARLDREGRTNRAATVAGPAKARATRAGNKAEETRTRIDKMLDQVGAGEKGWKYPQEKINKLTAEERSKLVDHLVASSGLSHTLLYRPTPDRVGNYLSNNPHLTEGAYSRAHASKVNERLERMRARQVPQHEAPEVLAHQAVMAHAAEAAIGPMYGPPRPPTPHDEAIQRMRELGLRTVSRRTRAPGELGPSSSMRDIVDRRMVELGLISKRGHGGDAGAGLYVVNEMGPEAFIEGRDINKLRARRPDIYGRIPGAKDGARTGMIQKPAWSMFAPQKDGLIVRREDALEALGAVRAQRGAGTGDEDLLTSRGPIGLPGGGSFPPFYGPPVPPTVITHAGGGPRSEEMTRYAAGLGQLNDEFLRARREGAMDALRESIASATASAAEQARQISGVAATPPPPPAAARPQMSDFPSGHRYWTTEAGQAEYRRRDRFDAAQAASRPAPVRPPRPQRRQSEHDIDLNTPEGQAAYAAIQAARTPQMAGGPLSSAAKKALAQAKEDVISERRQAGLPTKPAGLVEEARRGVAGTERYEAAGMPRRVFANISQALFGGGTAFRQRQADFTSAQARYNAALSENAKTSLKVESAQKALNKTRQDEDPELHAELEQKLSKAKKDHAGTSRALRQETDKLAAATKAVQPGLGSVIQSFGSIVVATTAYGAAIQVASEAFAAAGPALKATADEALGFGATSQRVTKSIGESAAEMGGNVQAAIGKAAGGAGLGTAGYAAAQQYLTGGVTAKAGAGAAQQSSDLYRAIAGAIRGAPEGLRGGYGGLGGGAIFGEQLGGGKGSEEILTKDLKALQGQSGAALATGAAKVRALQRPSNGRFFTPEERAASQAAIPQAAAEAQQQSTQLLQLRDDAVKDYNEAQTRYTKRMGQAESGLHLITEAEAGGKVAFDALAGEAQKAANDSGIQDWADRVKETTEAHTVLVDALGHAVTTVKEQDKYWESVVGGKLIPTTEEFVAQQKEALRGRRQSRAMQAERQVGVELPYEVTKQLLANPQIQPGLGFFGQNAQGAIGTKELKTAGVSAGARGAVGGALAEATESQASLAKISADGLAATRAEIQQWGDPGDLGNFDAANKAATDVSRSIAGMTTKMMGLNQAASQANWANQFRLANRALNDANALLGKTGKSRLGQLEREQFLISRASQSLSLALQQRQITTNLALAQFQAPGETGEERYMRQKERIAEAGIQQKQLGLAKEDFSVAGKLWTETAKRAAQDAQAALGVMQKARDAEAYAFVAASAIASRQQELAQHIGKMDSVVNKARDNWSDALNISGNKVETWGGNLADVFRDVIKALGYEKNNQGTFVPKLDKYGNPIGITSSTGRMGRYAAGYLGGFAGGATFTVGEAGPETVAILRNPRTHMLGGENGSSAPPVVNININGASVRDDHDIEKLAARVAAEVEMALSRKGQLLGLRSPAY